MEKIWLTLYELKEDISKIKNTPRHSFDKSKATSIALLYLH